jgi:AbrB family looped-hinge helix DNA binding protein
MAMVTVSPKFQIVIPKELREKLSLRPGEQLFMYELQGSLRVERKRSLRELRGIARGMNWKDDYRDRTDRF